MEISLRHLDGVGKVAISAQKQMFAVYYEAGARFQPKELRDAVGKASVKVVRFHISGQGKVQQEGDDQILIVGKDRYLLVDSPKMPVNVSVGFIGAVMEESTDPFELKVDDFKPLK